MHAIVLPFRWSDMRWIIAAILLALCMSAANAEIDPKSGLIVDAHWELVLGMCGSCHSYKLVTAQRGDRDYWLKTIRWMQKTQNLWAIPEPIETKLLDYLAKNYSETEWARRPLLPPDLMPSDSL